MPIPRAAAVFSFVASCAVVGACTGDDSSPAAADAGTSSDGGTATDGGGGGGDGSAAGPGTAVVTFDPNAEAAKDLRVDGTNVYFTRVKLSSNSFKTASIEKVPVAGGATAIVAADVLEPSFLALDATYVYYARFVCNATVPCGVYRVAKSGGAPQTLAESPDGGMPLVVTGLAVDDTYVWFGASNYDRLFRVKKDGSGAMEAVTSSDAGIRGVMTDSQYVYWVDAAVGSVKFFRMTKAGGAPEALATLSGSAVGHTATNVRAASLTDTEIVWADTGDDVGSANQIVRLPKTPGGTTTVVKDGLRFVGAAEAFGGNVYFTDGSLEKIAVAGGAVQTLAPYPVNPTTQSPIAVDATGVYWITVREIRRLAF